MDEESSTPLGVKMLADHLVKVKLQYEERINELLQYIKTIEKEKKELQQHYKEMEDELEMRRQEIYQMKREASNDYVVEERENWKALLNQQRQENEKLKKDIEINKARIKSLEDQLKLVEEEMKESEEAAESPKEESEAVDSPMEPVDEADVSNQSSNSTDQTSEDEAMQMGPPQPLAPPVSDSPPSLDMLLIQKQALEEELARTSKSISKLQGDVKEGRELNKKLTDQFMKKVDLLETEHRERENMLLSTIEGLKSKLDIELEKKWELTQQIHAEEQERSSIFSFLWG